MKREIYWGDVYLVFGTYTFGVVFPVGDKWQTTQMGWN